MKQQALKRELLFFSLKKYVVQLKIIIRFKTNYNLLLISYTNYILSFNTLHTSIFLYISRYVKQSPEE